jgi:glycosyltransferase involved in cell wall biosynthesis
LLYQHPHLIGTYAGYPRVEEVAAVLPGTVLWDQAAVPWVAKQQQLDLVFNPKFTVPFCTKAKTVFVLHGSEWFVLPSLFRWYDRWYATRMIPQYCRRADVVITVSHAVKQDVVRYTGVAPHKVIPIHNGFDPERFRVIREAPRLQAVRAKYRLPERFILWVGQIEARKNMSRLLQAFAQLTAEFPHHLVLAGVPRWSPTDELQMVQQLDLQARIQLPGWIDHEDLPAIYNLAELFVFPSLYEGFGIPLLEAMACGCPIITANTGAPPEVVGDAAYLVSPGSVEELVTGIRAVLRTTTLRQEMIAKGLERVQAFNWDACAKRVLAVFEALQG